MTQLPPHASHALDKLVWYHPAVVAKPWDQIDVPSCSVVIPWGDEDADDDLLIAGAMIY